MYLADCVLYFRACFIVQDFVTVVASDVIILVIIAQLYLVSIGLSEYEIDCSLPQVCQKASKILKNMVECY